jgi:predicted RNA binding protein YcfA (HicA-like mRNA interferase family)
MTKLPSLTGEQVIKALSKAGFQMVKAARQPQIPETF